MEYGSRTSKGGRTMIRTHGSASVGIGKLVADGTPFVVAETITAADNPFGNPGAQRVFLFGPGTDAQKLNDGDTLYIANGKSGLYLGRFTVLDLTDVKIVGRLPYWTIVTALPGLPATEHEGAPVSLVKATPEPEQPAAAEPAKAKARR